MSLTPGAALEPHARARRKESTVRIHLRARSAMPRRRHHLPHAAQLRQVRGAAQQFAGVRAALGELYALIADAESAQRKYILIGNQSYRTQYSGMVARI